jgi:hypothetical protein
MPDVAFYRKQAAHARELGDRVRQSDLREILRQTAKEYDEIVEDLIAGVAEVRHPELLTTARP